MEPLDDAQVAETIARNITAATIASDPSPPEPLENTPKPLMPEDGPQPSQDIFR